jgi:hypothetical protein
VAEPSPSVQRTKADLKSQIPNFKSEISNPKFQIPNFKFGISNPKFQISNLKSQISNLKFDIQTPEPAADYSEQREWGQSKDDGGKDEPARSCSLPTGNVTI